MESLTPMAIVKELDKYIVGQEAAKRSVAIALRNRYRRRCLPEKIKEDILPKNIIMIGATGVGKTEIARRLANLVRAPFIKVEATKFTEVGYVGRDVDSIIRDLTGIAVRLVTDEANQKIAAEIDKRVEERILDLLMPSSRDGADLQMPESGVVPMSSTREKMRKMLQNGVFEKKEIEIDVEDSFRPVVEIFSGTGMEELGFNFKSIMGSVFPKRTRKKNVRVEEARSILAQEESQKLLDMDDIVKRAIELTESSGLVFIDEIDKIVATGAETSGPHVSREGVQRDLLPIVEGSTVMTKYGPVRTHHILFIAAGAFHNCKPSDLIPELQGRFPIRVELQSLTVDDFKNILVKPKNSLIKQYTALLGVEGVELSFTPDGIEKIAQVSFDINSRTENIGARRLFTVMEKVLEEISFQAPEIKEKKIVIDSKYVAKKLDKFCKDEDLSRYIL